MSPVLASIRGMALPPMLRRGAGRNASFDYPPRNRVGSAHARDARGKWAIHTTQRRMTMAKTFGQMVAEARSEVEVLSPQDAQQRMQANPDALVLDVRQAE